MTTSRRRRGWVAAVALLGLGLAAAAWSLRARTVYETVTLAQGDIEATVQAIGKVQPRSYVDVGAQVSGQILRLHVAPGTRVAQGDLLVEIDPSVAQAAVDAGRAQVAGLRAQVAEQRARHRQTAQELARQRAMDADGATSRRDRQLAQAEFDAAAARIEWLQAQIVQIEATLKADEARLRYTRIYAPMAGTVVTVDAREGQTLNATYQTPIVLRIADLATMTVWTEVSEADVRRVVDGMPVWFTTLGNAADGAQRRWHSKVQQVLPAPPTPDKPAAAAGSSNGTSPAPATQAVVYTVLFSVDNSDGELMPLMTAQVVFVTARAEGTVLTPLSALESGAAAGQYTARVLAPDGSVEPRTVRLGVRSRHQAQVVEGLVAGDALVTGQARRGGLPDWLQW